MVLLEQISALLDFLESQPELALGHFNRSIEGRSLAKRRWAECAQILNSVAADCPNKSPTEWRSFYNEFKSKLMKKIKLQKGEMSATGGGPAKKIIFTPLQERLYNILGRDIGEPLAGVRHNPLSLNVSLLANPAMEVDASTNASTTNNSFSILDPSYALDVEPLILSLEPEMVGSQPPSNLQSPSDLQPSRDLQPPASPVLHPPQAQPRLNQPSRRRRRPTRHAEEREHAALEAAQARLEQMEARNAEVTLAQAQATEHLAVAIDRLGTATNQAADRLAAAIEKVGQMISLFVEPPSKKKRRKLETLESESEEM